jgi:NHL repeat-containing protein
VFLVDDPNDGDCPAASAKAIGRGAKDELGCQARDVRKPGTFAACDANEDGKTSVRLTTVGACVDPDAVAAAIDECDAALDAMVQVQPIPCGTFLTSWGSAGSGDGQFNALTGVAVDASGGVFVTDTQGLRSPTNRIQKFDPNGIFLAKWGSLGSAAGQFCGPSDIAVDGSGNVFVADTANRIQKFACP